MSAGNDLIFVPREDDDGGVGISDIPHATMVQELEDYINSDGTGEHQGILGGGSSDGELLGALKCGGLDDDDDCSGDRGFGAIQPELALEGSHPAGSVPHLVHTATSTPSPTEEKYGAIRAEFVSHQQGYSLEDLAGVVVPTGDDTFPDSLLETPSGTTQEDTKDDQTFPIGGLIHDPAQFMEGFLDVDHHFPSTVPRFCHIAHHHVPMQHPMAIHRTLSLPTSHFGYSSLFPSPLSPALHSLPSPSIIRRVLSTGDIQPNTTQAGPSTTNTSSTSQEDPTALKVGRYTAEERKVRIDRYRQKRSERNYIKKIKYACRKTLADSRPRIRGRFAKNQDAGLSQNKRKHEDDDDDECDIIVEDDEEYFGEKETAGSNKLMQVLQSEDEELFEVLRNAMQ